MRQAVGRETAVKTLCNCVEKSTKNNILEVTSVTVFDLPAELWDDCIFGNELFGLTPHDLARFSRVCKRFYEVAHGIRSMQRKIKEYMEKGLLTLHGSTFDRSIPAYPASVWIPDVVDSTSCRAWPNLTFHLQYVGQYESHIEKMKAITTTCRNVLQHCKLYMISDISDAKDSSLLSSAHTVGFCGCNLLQKGILESLVCVNSLSLESCKVNLDDLSHLTKKGSSLQSLCITSHPLVSVAPLQGGVQMLSLHDCDLLRDLSGLHRVHTLIIEHCVAVQDISCLSHIHTLHIDTCSGITDVQALSNVHTLTLKRCHNIQDVSPLKTVKVLRLKQCDKIRDVSKLGTVPTLEISRCSNVTSVDDLGDCDTLTLRLNKDCEKDPEISQLGSVRVLTLENFNHLQNVSSLANVQELTLYCCRRLRNVDVLCKVQKLNILRCNMVSITPALDSVPTLNVTFDNFQSLEMRVT
eukprot:m.100625 g.100625  ORF g.100625 m.100625 type:complete len:467 (+) comp13715_c0_seq1:185-1585(+)